MEDFIQNDLIKNPEENSGYSEGYYFDVRDSFTSRFIKHSENDWRHIVAELSPLGKSKEESLRESGKIVGEKIYRTLEDNTKRGETLYIQTSEGISGFNSPHKAAKEIINSTDWNLAESYRKGMQQGIESERAGWKPTKSTHAEI